MLGVAGVSHWILFSLGFGYFGTFHVITMTQSFLLAFASGFLMTAIPKRTGSAPATSMEIVVLAGLVPGVAVAASFGAVIGAELSYIAALGTLIQFALRRLIGGTARRRPPASFCLIPLALVAGIVGAALFARGTWLEAPTFWFYLGRRLVLEAVFILLALGIGTFFLPLALRGEAAPDVTHKGSYARYLAWGSLVLATFALQEAGAARAAWLARGLLMAGGLLASGALRRPTRSGTNRRLLWISAATLPVGPLVAAAFPFHAVAAMHLTFIGGLNLLAFAVATHVSFAHLGFDALQGRTSWAVVTFGTAFLVAALVRASATAAPAFYVVALGIAAAAWSVGALVWLSFLLPKYARPSGSEGSPPDVPA
jgi:uncharacterized protein involved in response to NO